MSNLAAVKTKSTTSNLQFVSSSNCFSFQPDDCDIIVQYENGLKQGKAEAISKAGIRIASLNYRDDKLHGLCVKYNENGSIQMEGIFDNGILNGWGREYENFEPVYSGFYKNGQRFSKLVDIDGRDEKKEMHDGVILSISKYDENHNKHGVCYSFEKGSIVSCVQYDHGTVVYVMKEFLPGNRMKEYNKEHSLLFDGYHSNSFETCYSRHGKGYEMMNGHPVFYCEYVNGEKKRIISEFSGEIMKEYNDHSKLIYEGGYSGNVERGYSRNGRGIVFENEIPKKVAVFENGVERYLQQTFDNSEMKQYDTTGRILYRGSFHKDGTSFYPFGKGKNYHYENSCLSSIYHCVNGEDTSIWMKFGAASMKEFDEDGSIVYEGEGSGEHYRHGTGSEYKDGSVVYSGKWVENKRCGEGMYYKNHAIVYSGEWKNDLPNGFGRKLNDKGTVVYSGIWKNGYSKDSSGVWKYYDDDGDYALDDEYRVIYQGSFSHGVPHGQGTLLKDNNPVYTGNWKMGDLQIEEHVYVNYKVGVPEVRNRENQVIYRGGWKNGCPEGYGSVYNNHRIMYQGTWENGVLLIEDDQFLDIEGCEVYITRIKQSSGLFSCCMTKRHRSPLVFPAQSVIPEPVFHYVPEEPVKVKESEIVKVKVTEPVKVKNTEPVKVKETATSKIEKPAIKEIQPTHPRVAVQKPEPPKTVLIDIPAPLPFMPSYKEPW